MQVPTPLEFLQRVVPWPGPDGLGYGNVIWKIKGQWRGRPFKTAEEAIGMAQYLATRPQIADDIYYNMLLMRNTGQVIRGKAVAKRNKANAMASRCLWADVDIKPPPKGYMTLDEAKQAVVQFCVDANLPLPTALVHSGNGLHVYWIFNRVMTVEEWEPYALGLTELIATHKLRADPVSADAARVLRVPGTFNRKDPANPLVVRLIRLMPTDYDPSLFAHLKVIGDKIVAARAPAVTAPVTKAALPPLDPVLFPGVNPLFAHINPMEDVLSAGIENKRDWPIDPKRIIKLCPHFRDSLFNGGKGQNQGLWMQTVLAATWMDDARHMAHLFSKDYPDYDPAKTDAMFDRKLDDRAKLKLGYPACETFENNGCTHCKTCPIKAAHLVRSPLNLGVKIDPNPKPAPGVEQVEFKPAAASSVTVVTKESLMLPDGLVTYALDPGGIICLVVEKKKKKNPDGTDPDDDAENHELYPLFHARVIGKPWASEAGLHFTYADKFHERNVIVPDEVMSGPQTLAANLLKQKVHVTNDKLVVDFMRSWVSKIREAQLSETTAAFGWVDGHDGKPRGFAYGGHLYTLDGRVERSSPPMKSLLERYTPKGTVEPILEMMEILREDDYAPAQIMALQSWASPLLFTTGVLSTAVWGWSDKSAFGKTTAIYTGMALWSAPTRSKENCNITNAGLEVKMNELKNLPLVVDEMAYEADVDKFVPVFNLVSEGGSASKSNRNRSDLLPHPEWKCIMVCGANKSIHDRQVALNISTDAHVRRVFEIKLEKRERSRKGSDVELIRNKLDNNYGHLGAQYAQFLAINRDAIEKRGKEINDDFSEKVKREDEDRYWIAACSCTILAAELANQMLGKAYFNRDKIEKELIEQFLYQRKWVEENVRVGSAVQTADEILGRFLEAHTNNQLGTWKLHRSGRPKPGEYAAFITPAPNSGRGNVAVLHWCAEDKLLHIHSPRFRRWCAEELPPNSPSANSVIKTLQRTMNAKVSPNKIDMLAGTGLQISQLPVPVIEIPVTGTFLEGVLDKLVHGSKVTPVVEAADAMVEQDAQKTKGPVDLGPLVTAAVIQSQKDHALMAGLTGATGAQ